MQPKIQPWTWIVLAVLVLAATAGRWISAEHLANPRYNTARQFSGDEVVYIMLADRLWKEGRYDTRGLSDQLPLDRNHVHIPKYLEAPLFKHPPLFPFLVGLSRILFWGVQGSSIYPSLVMSAVSLLAIFWLCLELGLAPAQGLLAVLLLAASPVHWICSSRIWLDMTLMTFILLAITAQVRALRFSGWWKASGFFWGCALLTKYTAFAPWICALVAALLLWPGLRRDRAFWTGQAVAAGMFLPWLAARFWFDGFAAAAFWKSDVEDWRTLSRMVGWVWFLPLLAGAVWLWLQCRKQDWHSKWMNRQALLAWGTLAFIGFFLAMHDRLPLETLPWSGYGLNVLRNSPRDFYLVHPILFEPVCWWGMLGLLAFRQRAAWDLMRAMWLGLFLFLTLWGNFQSRYGLPLVPFEMVFAAALLLPGESRGNRWACGLAAVWVVYSCAHSFWIVKEVAIPNKFFYF